MGEFGGGFPVADGNAHKRRRVGQQRLFNKTDVNPPVLQSEQGFSQIGDYGIAQGGDADGAEVAD